MSRARSVVERVNEYVKKNPSAYDIMVTEVNQILALGDNIDIITTAFAFGYMKGFNAKKGGKS